MQMFVFAIKRFGEETELTIVERSETEEGARKQARIWLNRGQSLGRLLHSEPFIDPQAGNRSPSGREGKRRCD